MGGIVTITSAVWVAKIQAQTQTQKDLNEFKVTTIEDIGIINAKIDVINTTVDLNGRQIEKRLETMQGSLNTITSKLLND